MAQRILRPLDYGGLLDELFDLYKKNFLLFAGISAIAYIPMYVITFGLLFGAMAGMSGFDHTTNGRGVPDEVMIQSLIKMGIAFVVLMIGSMIAYALAQAATTWAISRRYLDEPATIVDSFRAIWRRAFMYGITVTVCVIIIYVGFALCIVPGVIFAFWFAFVSQVYVIEGKSMTAAMSRSKELVAGQWGRVLVVGIVAVIIAQVIQQVITYPFQFASELGAVGGGMSIAGILNGLGAGIAMALVNPITAIAFTLLYYDIRIRKEGFDIQMLAKNMGGGSPSPETTIV